MIERTLPALLACSLFSPALAPPPRQDEAQHPPAREEAKRAIDAGDFERAHALLTELVLAQRLDRAAVELAADRPEAAWELLQTALELAPRSARARTMRAELSAVLLARWLGEARPLLAVGAPRDAMLILDEAVALAPDDPEVHFLRGECTLRMGIEDGDVIAFDDARRSFLEAAGSGSVPEAWAGAARSLFQIYFDSGRREDLERALEYARRGREETPEGSLRVALMSFSPPRTHADVAFHAYTTAKLAQDDPGSVAERFEESRGAYEALIGRAPEDPFAWRSLADLFAWEGRRDEAREFCLRALEILPDERTLHEKLVDIERARAGSEAVIATYGEWTAAHPEAALGHWWLGAETLERALSELQAGNRELDSSFAAAEGEFARCAELAPEHAEASAGYMAICRSGLGWCRYHRGELDAARAAFLAMEQCLPGGLRWEYPGKLPSGVKSLRFVIDGYMQRAAGDQTPAEERNQALESAAEIATYLHEYQADDVDLANNAGFLNRDAGVALQQQGELLLRRSIARAETGETPPPEDPAAARAAAEAFLARARERMEKSHRAYSAAAALAPDDARIQNDTGLILIHYLQRDLDTAEAYLRRAIEVGKRQLAAGIEDEAQREAVTEAVGDAHENMGVLLLTLRGEAQAAIPWFEQSIAIGPFPRPPVEHRHLPLCRKVLDGAVDVGIVRRASYWGALEPELVLERIRTEDELRGILRP